ncbi:MAG: hypothetical protein ACPGLV_05560 [Bacteroidia bacterium]
MPFGLFSFYLTFITSSGGSNCFEPALYLCELLYGKKVAEEIAKGMVIEWNVTNYNFNSPYQDDRFNWVN